MRSNREMLLTVANGLRDFLDKIYFVGGSVIELYLADSVSDPVRPTKDVDLVLEITSKFDFRDWEKLLRSCGFRHDMSDNAPICRWIFNKVLVDTLVPNLQMGFTNKWYAEGIKHSFDYQLNKNLQIKLFELPYFLATKFEAVLHRGASDLRTSHDFEDIVYLWSNVPDILGQCQKAEDNLQNYFSITLKNLMSNWTFNEAIEVHLPFDSILNAERIKREMRFFTTSV
ncbi:MAG: nucleotidyl transferase AbiEii/AbiGii toxin family protein [Fibromonadales bacterium]|nr:nucleotidyl transferase AbiEii/AbiGii toxin family protein [Fibromonadales bacterium]